MKRAAVRAARRLQSESMTHSWLVEKPDGGIYLASQHGPGHLPTFVTARWLSHEECIGSDGHRVLFGDPLPTEVTGSESEVWPYAQVEHIKRAFLAPVLRGLYPRDKESGHYGNVGPDADIRELRDEAQRWAPFTDLYA